MCNTMEHGEIVKCQIENPQEPYYGDACTVGHTGMLVDDVAQLAYV